MPINQNQALFSLLGTTYGGDGRVNFGLPNLQGRAPIHMGNGHTLGELGGELAHTLNLSEMPQHVHLLQAQDSQANQTSPGGNLLANTTGAPLAIFLQPPGTAVPMLPDTVTTIGGNQAHTNQSPFLTMNWIIALQGIFPSQT
jgi:microcystin-dependent protein